MIASFNKSLCAKGAINFSNKNLIWGKYIPIFFQTSCQSALEKGHIK